MKKQPKPKPCECWCLTQFDGTIWPGWCCDSREQAREWKHIMPDPGEIIRVRIVPVAPKKRAKAKRGGK